MIMQKSIYCLLLLLVLNFKTTVYMITHFWLVFLYCLNVLQEPHRCDDWSLSRTLPFTFLLGLLILVFCFLGFFSNLAQHVSVALKSFNKLDRFQKYT